MTDRRRFRMPAWRPTAGRTRRLEAGPRIGGTREIRRPVGEAGAAIIAPPVVVSLILLLFAVLAPVGCTTVPPGPDPVVAYYNYDFPTARKSLRMRTDGRVDDDRLLDLLRLGAASMADGDVAETERAFREAFDLLSTAGLNADRTVAAVLLHEGVRIWKGEPFEQALAYTWIATHYGTRGDWENMRAAAANSLFRLTDFGQEFSRDTDATRLVRRSMDDPDLLVDGYRAVESEFAFGQLLTAIGADLSGSGGAGSIFDRLTATRPDLASMVTTLRERDYDTLLVVDYGRGPAKVAYGPDNAFVRHDARERRRGSLWIESDGVAVIEAQPIVDVNSMASQLRWNALENVRRAKSAVGEFLMFGGLTAVAIGANEGSREAVIAGAIATLVGLAMRSGAAADTRHLEMLPAAVYLVPMRLGGMVDLTVSVAPPSASRVLLPDFVPGEPGRPRMAYLRLHGMNSPAPAWLTSDELLYGNDHTTVAPGDFPWILGGADVGTPTPERLAAYKAAGTMAGWSIRELQRHYDEAGIVVGTGRGDRNDPKARHDSFRHILEGGTGLFTPQPDSIGYKRIMFSPTRRTPPFLEDPADAASGAESFRD